jgi:hypothetical protein
VEHPVQQTRNGTAQAPSCHSEPRVEGPHRSSCMHGTAYLHHNLLTVTEEQLQPVRSDQQQLQVLLQAGFSHKRATWLTAPTSIVTVASN